MLIELIFGFLPFVVFLAGVVYLTFRQSTEVSNWSWLYRLALKYRPGLALILALLTAFMWLVGESNPLETWYRAQDNAIVQTTEVTNSRTFTPVYSPISPRDTVTYTPTNTAIPTPSNTPTPTPTFTITPVTLGIQEVTNTPEPTPTLTLTYTPSPTPIPNTPTPTATPICYGENEGLFYFEEPKHNQYFVRTQNVPVKLHLRPGVYPAYRHVAILYTQNSPAVESSWREFLASRYINCGYPEFSCSQTSSGFEVVRYEAVRDVLPSGTYWILPKLYTIDANYTEIADHYHCAVRITIR